MTLNHRIESLPPRLSVEQWNHLRQQHVESVQRWTVPFRERRRCGESHPVHDFLFVYYQYSPTKLENWHAGAGVVLEDAAPFVEELAHDAYRITGNDVVLDEQAIQGKELSRLRWTKELLEKTAAQKPNFSCLGLHEWAMVYRGKDVRHEQTTALRLSQEAIDELVESRPLTCTHFDAFRFFADDARPMNRHLPTMESRPEMEQPACIHANMDLYKWAFKAMPWIGSDLLRRCFELAMSARAIDMRASPYDLAAYKDIHQRGYEPIRIESPEGRAEYERLQRKISARAAPLRSELIQKIGYVISLVEQRGAKNA